MKIELKNLKVSASLSEETVAYTATIYIDGKLAFHASNHGTGGPDMFQRVGDLTEHEVNAWLAVNAPPMGPFEEDPRKRADYDVGIACDLEHFVGRITAKAEADKDKKRIERAYDRQLASKICGTKDGKFYTFNAPPTETTIERLRASKPEFLILNGKPELRNAGLVAFCPNFFDGGEDEEEAVYARLRENRLTAADCRYLIAQDNMAEKPDPEAQAEWLGIAEAQEAKAQAYKDTLVERRAYDAGCEVIGQVS